MSFTQLKKGQTANVNRRGNKLVVAEPAPLPDGDVLGLWLDNKIVGRKSTELKPRHRAAAIYAAQEFEETTKAERHRAVFRSRLLGAFVPKDIAEAAAGYTPNYRKIFDSKS